MWSLVFRPNDSRMLVALGESYEKLSQQVEAKKVSIWWGTKILDFCDDLILDPDVFLFFVFFLVLLESVLCWRCRENGSAEVSKVRHDQLKHLFQLFFFVITLCNLFKILYVLTFCFFVFFFSSSGFMNNWMSRTMLLSVTCSTSKTFSPVGWVSHSLRF